MIALIVLIGMTLAGLALVRSLDTANIIAGNLAFQQAATQAGDAGSEFAIAWLEGNNAAGALDNDALASGYSASAPPLLAGQSWDNYWQVQLDPPGGPRKIFTLATDPVTGNTVSFAIQRLCNTAGPRTNSATGCAVSAAAVISNPDISSNDVGAATLSSTGQLYYRITSRIQGPRNTVSYVQTIASL